MKRNGLLIYRTPVDEKGKFSEGWYAWKKSLFCSWGDSFDFAIKELKKEYPHFVIVNFIKF